jgi:hypothetical protein
MFSPHIDGSVSIDSAAPRFLGAFTSRVEKGLLSSEPHSRSCYRVTEAAADRLAVRASDWPTALNVGLNEIELRVPGDGWVHYRVRYWRWTLFGLGLCGTLGLVGLALLLGGDARAYIARQPRSMMPGLSVDQNLRIAWVMVIFWGFVWPWVLVAMHRRPLRRLLVRIITEVDADATAGARQLSEGARARRTKPQAR